MMKKVLATVLTLSVLSTSAMTLPGELGSLKDIESKLIEQGVDAESLRESVLDLNLDPTLTEVEVAETIIDFTRSQLETGAAFSDDKIYEITKWGAIAFFALSTLARYSDSVEKRYSKSFLIIGAYMALISFICEGKVCEVENKDL